MSEKIIRFASYGTSSIMDVMQDAIQKTPGVQCTVVCSRSEERAKAYAEKIGVSQYCGSYEEVLKRDDIDAVYIATPNSLHVEHALQALAHGKHVVMEKPASLNGAGVLAMIEEARKNNVYFFEAITTIMMPNFIALKNMLPDLGQILNVQMRYGQYSSKLEGYLHGNPPNNMNPDVAGGALNDMGIYPIHAAINLFGAPDEVSYDPIYGPNNADVEGHLTMTYHTYPAHLSTQDRSAIEEAAALTGTNGLTVHIHTSKNRNNGSGIFVEGTQGYFEQTGHLNAFAVCRASVGAKETAVNHQEDCNRMIYEMSAFRDAINSHDDAFFEYMSKQSLEAAKVLEAAHKTMRW